MNKNVVYTIYSDLGRGWTNNYKKISEVQEAYSEYCNADYIFKTIDNLDYTDLQFEKLFMLEDLSKKYEKILYLDLDVIPNLNANNIFKLNYDLALFGMFDSSNNARKKLLLKREAHTKSNSIKLCQDYILNTGVIYASSNKINSLNIKKEAIEYLRDNSTANNEVFFTWLLEKNSVEYYFLPISYNWMVDKDKIPNYHLSHFTHFTNKKITFDFAFHQNR